MPAVYVVHLDPPFKHARHYVGFSTWVSRRLGHHANGTGATILRHAVAAGCRLHLGRVWRNGRRGTRRFERALKKREYGPLERLCAVCSERPTRRLRQRRRS